MTQNNARKEPTFGEPTTSEVVSETTKEVKNVIPSLRTTQSPGHTFTPVIKPAGTAKAELPKMEGGEAAKPAGFTFSPVAEEKAVEAVVTEAKAEVKVKEESKNVAQEAAKAALNTAERVIPTATNNAEQTPVKEGSSKRRRLGIVALLAAVLGALFFWLKPSTPETVEELQSQQGGSLPIEFRPVDEAEAQRAEAEAKAQQEAVQQAQAEQATQTQTSEPVQQSQVEAQPVAVNEPALQPSQETQVTQPVQPQPVTPERPETQGSVVYQPETVAVKAPTPAVQTPRVEKLRPATQNHANKPAQQPKIKAVTKAEFDAKKAQNAQMDRLVKNVEAGKPAVPAKVESVKATSHTATSAPAPASVASKTLTVPKGVSLMQVFRDNQLNISDVNAMSKVNNKVSNLKVNEKVTVRLDKNNRVVEMSIGSGGKFTRQADGSYQFK